jgi:hypothetical protein
MRALALSSFFASLSFAGTSVAAFDIVAQDLQIDVTGAPDATVLTVDATIDITSDTSSIVFYKMALNATAATLNGAPVTVEPHPSYPQYLSRVVPAAPLAAGETVTLHLELGGTLNCTVPGFPGVSCWRTSDETILTPSMPGAAWYLINMDGADPFLGSIAVRAPDGQTVIAGSNEEIEVHGDGTSTHRSDFAPATEVLGLYAGAADTIEVSDGFPVRAVHHAQDHNPENVAFAAQVTSDLLPILESHYGELPIEEARIVVVPSDFGFGGLGLLGTVLLNEVVVGPAAAILEQGMGHEFSHSWWGNLACGNDPIERRFLGEAFAEYAAWRALGELRGDALRTSGMRMNAVWYMYRRPNNVDVPVLSAATADSPVAVHVIYHKGPLVLRTVEEAAGPEAYAEALRAFLHRGYGQLSMDGFIADVKAASGYDAAADVDQWLRNTGFPIVAAGATVDESAVHLSLTSAAEFNFALPVRVVFSDGRTVDERLELAPGLVEHEIAIDDRPIAVEIDPRWTAVREITPALPGDVTLDGEVDGADLVAVAVAHGTELPLQRRIDGGYDPLYDLDRDLLVGDADLELVRAAVAAR